MAAAEIFLIVAQATPIILSLVLNSITLIISVMRALLPVCVTRAKNIPSHIEAIMEIFRQPNIDANSKKILAVVLIALTGIIPFIAFSLIPFTGVPVIGLLTFPIACMLSFLLVCFSYEVVIIPILKSQRVNLENLKIDFDKIKEDYLSVRHSMGPKWEKFVEKTRKIIKEHANEIEKIGKDLDIKVERLCEHIEESIEPSLKELTIFLNSNEKVILAEEELKIIEDRMAAWQKVGVSGALSVAVGAGGAATAKSLLIPATLWNSVLSSIGLGSGTLVSATTFTVASIYAPIALGGLAFYAGIKGLKKIEQARLSDFLADVIIASMPMIYADGLIQEEEIDTIQHLISNPSLREKDRKRVLQALENPINIDDIVNGHIMYEKNGEKSKIKARLLLSIAWEIAKADNKINEKEKEMHDKMARIFQVEDIYCQEVRSLLIPVQT